MLLSRCSSLGGYGLADDEHSINLEKIAGENVFEIRKKIVRHGGSLVDSTPFVRKVVGSNPTLTTT